MSIFENFDAVLTALIAIGSSVTTYLVAKMGTKKDIVINQRTSLSEDEEKFRKELRTTIDSYKNELKEARLEITELRKEVAGLHKINLKLTLENKQLQIKVQELIEDVQRLQ